MNRAALFLLVTSLLAFGLLLPAGSSLAGGACSLQDGFDLWEGRWRLTLSAPGASSQVVVIELIETGSVVTGGFDTVDGRLRVSATANRRELTGSFTVSGAGGGPLEFRMTPSFRAFNGTWFKPTTTARGTYLGGGPSRACVLLGTQGDSVVNPGEKLTFSAFVQAEGPAALPNGTTFRITYPAALEVPSVFDQLESSCHVHAAERIITCTVEALGPGKRRAAVGLEFDTAARHAGRRLAFVLEVAPGDLWRLPVPAGQVHKTVRLRVRS